MYAIGSIPLSSSVYIVCSGMSCFSFYTGNIFKSLFRNMSRNRACVTSFAEDDLFNIQRTHKEKIFIRIKVLVLDVIKVQCICIRYNRVNAGTLNGVYLVDNSTSRVPVGRKLWTLKAGNS